MKATALILLSIASVAGLAGIATANPFTGREAQSEGFGNLVRESGFNVSDVAGGVGLANVFREGGVSSLASGFTPGADAGGTTALVSTPLGTPAATVPEGGSTLLFLGAGILALGLLRRGWVRPSY